MLARIQKIKPLHSFGFQIREALKRHCEYPLANLIQQDITQLAKRRISVFQHPMWFYLPDNEDIKDVIQILADNNPSL